jgi:diaminopimelate epimerase
MLPPEAFAPYGTAVAGGAQMAVGVPSEADYIQSMRARFVKMHGCGNDFVVFDERAGLLGLTAARAAAIADRRTGVGCDQFIVIEPAAPGADAFMRIRNPDGSEAGACGNATRCVVHLLAAESGRDRLVIRTISGDLAAEVLPNGQIRVDMGLVRLNWQDIPLAHPMHTLDLDLTVGPVSHPAAANMGNPHATFFVSDIGAIPIQEIGPVLEHHSLFPKRANIGFAQVLGPERIRLRVWERGAGLTLACGSGACAALVNAARRGLTGRSATIVADGGELIIRWREDDHVLMTGPVATVFTGEIDLVTLPLPVPAG